MSNATASGMRIRRGWERALGPTDLFSEGVTKLVSTPTREVPQPRTALRSERSERSQR